VAKPSSRVWRKFASSFLCDEQVVGEKRGEISFREVCEDRLAWCRRVGRHAHADPSADFDRVIRFTLLEDEEFVLGKGGELRGLASIIAQSLQRVPRAEHEASVVDLRPGEIRDAIGERESAIVLTPVKPAAQMHRFGDARDRIVRQSEFAGDLGGGAPIAVAAEQLKDRERAVRPGGGRVGAQGDGWLVRRRHVPDMDIRPNLDSIKYKFSLDCQPFA
jgi:hypothetical protein